MRSLEITSNPLAVGRNPSAIIPGLGQNPWDFDIQPDEDFVLQVIINV
jgi:hypothetical protein